MSETPNTTPEVPAPATLPTGITPERLTKLKALCKARCVKDADPRTAARALYKTMRDQFNQLRPATQDQLLAMMEATLPAAMQFITTQPPAGLVDQLCASITSEGQATSPLTPEPISATIITESTNT